jgi:MFS family permease
MVAIGSLLLIVTVSLVVTRVATVILTATGMAAHVARFQARSALTGAGFTTSESEKVVNHPLRRRVIATLMLLGNVGVVGAASSLILGFGGGSAGRQGWRVLQLAAGLLVLLIISRSRWVDERLTALISHFVQRHTDLDERDLVGLLKLSGEYAVQELAVGSSDWIAERSLEDLQLWGEGILVLGITRSDGRFLGAPDGDTLVHVGDNLVVYGRGGNLRELDRRPRGAAGDRAHEAAVREQDQLQEREGAEDDAHRAATASVVRAS